METQDTKKVLWTVSLSNGENVYEEKGDYRTVAGELSPWQKLLKRLADENLKITALSLYTMDGRRFNLPSAGKNPKFRAFDQAPKPIEFKMFRKIGGDVRPDGSITNQDKYTIAEAKYDTGVVIQVWVDEKTLNSWSLVI